MVVVTPAPAARIAHPRWGSGRTWLGLGLVVAALVGVIGVVASADDRTGVWAIRGDLAAGSQLSADDLVVAAVRLPDASAYVTADRSPVGSVLTRDLTAGELVPAAALTDPAGQPQRLVTVPVERYHLPADLSRGERVDIYLVVRGATGQPVGDPVPVLRAATVAAVEDDGSRFGGSSLETGVALSVRPEQVSTLVGAAARGSLTLVRVPAAAP